MDMRLKAQALAFGKCWTFVVDPHNGHVMAKLSIAGRVSGVALFYESWAEALQDIAPVKWTHVFVEVGK